MNTEKTLEYKHIKLNSVVSNSKIHWKYNETPTFFDVDVDFKLKFDTDKILKDYSDYDTYYWKNVRKKLSEYSIYLKLINTSEKLITDFNITGVVNTTETDIKNVVVNLSKNGSVKKYSLGYSVTFESETDLLYKKKHIIDIGNNFVNYFENSILTNTDYYMIYR